MPRGLPVVLSVCASTELPRLIATRSVPVGAKSFMTSGGTVLTVLPRLRWIAGRSSTIAETSDVGKATRADWPHRPADLFSPQASKRDRMRREGTAWEGRMRCGWVAASLTGAMIAMPCASWAQQQPVRQAQAPKAKQKAQPQPADLDVEELTPAQIKRAQAPEPQPGTKGAAKAAPKESTKESVKPSAAAAARVVTCS